MLALLGSSIRIAARSDWQAEKRLPNLVGTTEPGACFGYLCPAGEGMQMSRQTLCGAGGCAGRRPHARAGRGRGAA